MGKSNSLHDMDMSNAGGGLGDLINNWNSLYYGIDRFREQEKSDRYTLGHLRLMI